MDSFENEEMAVMQWIRGQQYTAEALTKRKRNVVMFRLLNAIMKDGFVNKS